MNGDFLPPGAHSKEASTDHQAWDVGVSAAIRHEDPAQASPDSDQESQKETEPRSVAVPETDDELSEQIEGDGTHQSKGDDEVDDPEPAVQRMSDRLGEHGMILDGLASNLIPIGPPKS